MIINKLIKKEEWNKFVIHNSGSFLQAFEWGEFQQILGRKIWKIKDNFFQALIIKHNLPLGKNYLYCPRGPTIRNSQFSILNFQLFLEKIEEIVAREKPIFFRIEPEWLKSEENEKILKELGFRKSLKEVQPKKTLILDLRKSEKVLLAEMHPKTRYNINLAQRQGVEILNPKSEIQNSNFQYYFEAFWRLLQQTAKRGKFRPHSKEHYQKLLKFVPGANLFLASYQNKIIAANIVVFFGKRATYLHGASDNRKRNLMAPHLLQWQQILEAKKHGLTEYDFWGIDEKKWPGLTRFKKSFGGQEINYISTWDLILDKKQYAVYRFLTNLKITRIIEVLTRPCLRLIHYFSERGK